MLHEKRHIVPDFVPYPTAEIVSHHNQHLCVFTGLRTLQSGILDSIEFIFPQSAENP